MDATARLRSLRTATKSWPSDAAGWWLRGHAPTPMFGSICTPGDVTIASSGRGPLVSRADWPGFESLPADQLGWRIFSVVLLSPSTIRHIEKWAEIHENLKLTKQVIYQYVNLNMVREGTNLLPIILSKYCAGYSVKQYPTERNFGKAEHNTIRHVYTSDAYRVWCES